MGKNLDTLGETVVENTKDKIAQRFPISGGFTAQSKVDDDLEKLEVVHDIPGP